jgi:hypothetical protein
MIEMIFDACVVNRQQVWRNAFLEGMRAECAKRHRRQRETRAAEQE